MSARYRELNLMNHFELARHAHQLEIEHQASEATVILLNQELSTLRAQLAEAERKLNTRATEGVWLSMETAPKNILILLLVPEFGAWAESPWKGRWSFGKQCWALCAPLSENSKQVMVTDIPAPVGWQHLPPIANRRGGFMTEPLSPERSADVARHVMQQPFKYLYGSVLLDSDAGIVYWEPGKNIYQRENLTQTTARMIEERKKAYRETIAMPNPDFGIVNNDWQQHMERLNAAQATGDTNAIEVLLSELLEKSDG